MKFQQISKDEYVNLDMVHSIEFDDDRESAEIRTSEYTYSIEEIRYVHELMLLLGRSKYHG